MVKVVFCELVGLGELFVLGTLSHQFTRDFQP
jgi:hypothetical protein